jgi:hypothetical protein
MISLHCWHRLSAGDDNIGGEIDGAHGWHTVGAGAIGSAANGGRQRRVAEGAPVAGDAADPPSDAAPTRWKLLKLEEGACRQGVYRARSRAIAAVSSGSLAHDESVDFWVTSCKRRSIDGSDFSHHNGFAANTFNTQNLVGVSIRENESPNRIAPTKF